MTKTLITLTLFASLTICTQAAIPVPSTVLTFDTLPAAADWSTKSLGANAGDYAETNTPTTVPAMDAAINGAGNAASTITSRLGSATGTPGTAPTNRWSSNGFYLQSRPTGNAATLLMATLTNTTGSDITMLSITYNLATGVTPTAEDLPGHRIYYNLSGAAGSWVPVGNYGVVGPQNITVNLSGTPWPADTQMYLLFADDNASVNNDGAYQIDNFQVTAGPVALSVALTGPTNGASLNACRAPNVTATIGGSPTSVSYVVDGTPVVTLTAAPFSPAALPSLAIGSHQLYVSATDGATTVYSQTNTFTVAANLPPTVSIPDTYTLGVTGLVCLVGSCITNRVATADPDGTVTNLQFFINGTLLETVANPAADRTILVNDSLAGVNTFQAVATDNCGLAVTSAPVLVVVTNPPYTLLLTNGSAWRYAAGTNDLGTNGVPWAALSYDDASWTNGPAGALGNDTSPAFAYRTPIDIGTPRYRAIYFRRLINVSNPGQYTNLLINLLRDDGAVIYINSTPVWTNNIAAPNNGISYTNFASANTDNGTVYYQQAVNPAGLLVSGPNIIAVEVHQNSATSTDLNFDLMLWGQSTAPTLTIVNSGAGTSMISWPNLGTFNVHYSPNLNTPGSAWPLWTGSTPTLNGATGRWELIVPSRPGNAFFELRQ